MLVPIPCCNIWIIFSWNSHSSFLYCTFLNFSLLSSNSVNILLLLLILSTIVFITFVMIFSNISLYPSSFLSFDSTIIFLSEFSDSWLSERLLSQNGGPFREAVALPLGSLQSRLSEMPPSAALVLLWLLLWSSSRSLRSVSWLDGSLGYYSSHCVYNKIWGQVSTD